MPKSTKIKKVAETPAAEIDEAIEPVVEEVKEKEKPAKVKAAKKFAPEDMIPCRSIVSAELLIEGAKSRALYRWAGYGYVGEMQYQDLVYDIGSGNNSYARKPCFIVEDDEFLAQYPQLEEIYGTLYTRGDFEELLSKSADVIRQVAPTLPKGAREALKSYVATQVRSGAFDSMNKIRILDDIFGTQMATMLFPN